MAGTKDYAVLDLQDENDALGVDLQFQDFGDATTQPSNAHEQTINFTDFPDTAEDDPENEKLLGEEDEEQPVGLKAGAGFWTFDFYQQFFDVESKQVGDRILWSMVPKPGVSYLQSYIRPNPDLYGPFWICMTLTFTTAITGNLSNYLATNPEESYIWKYDFHKVTLAATAIFSYAWLVPLAMWGIMIWRGARAKISLLELLCIYGYSLAIFVPVSILWIVPQPWFKWCLAIVAPVLSGSVLVRTVWPSLSHDAKQIAIGIAAFILILHATLALGFMLYFFAAPDKPQSSIVPIDSGKVDAVVSQTPPTKRATAQDKDIKEIASDVKEALQKVPEGGGNDVKGGSEDTKVEKQVEVAEPLKQKPAVSSIEKKSVPSPSKITPESGIKDSVPLSDVKTTAKKVETEKKKASAKVPVSTKKSIVDVSTEAKKTDEAPPKS